MSRPRRARVAAPQMSETAWAMLNDLPVPADDGAGGWERFCLNYGGCLTTPSLQELWAEMGEGIVADWVAECPGTRPSCWWQWSAPRADEYQNVRGGLPLPRQRLGGIGTPKSEVLCIVPTLHLGLPVSWVSAWEADYYNGRALDIHGNRIGSDYKEGDFEGVPPDPNDPPRYESEASYLKHHDLLLPGERKRLTARDFQPECVPVEPTSN